MPLEDCRQVVESFILVERSSTFFAFAVRYRRCDSERENAVS